MTTTGISVLLLRLTESARAGWPLGSVLPVTVGTDIVKVGVSGEDDAMVTSGRHVHLVVVS